MTLPPRFAVHVWSQDCRGALCGYIGAVSLITPRLILADKNERLNSMVCEACVAELKQQLLLRKENA